MISKVKEAKMSSLKVVFVAMGVLTSATALAGTHLKFLTGTLDMQNWKPSSLVLSGSSTDTREYVIEFKNHISSADKNELETLGLKIYRYLPEDALIVKASIGQIKTVLRHSEGIQGIIPYAAIVKLSPKLPRVSRYSPEQDLTLKVSFFSDEAATESEAWVASFSESYFRQGKVMVLKIKNTWVPTLAEKAGVEFVESYVAPQTLSMRLETKDPIIGDPAPSPNGDYTDLTGYESGGKIVHIPSAWAQGFHGEGQIAGMADTGLDLGGDKVSADFQKAVHAGFADGIGADDWSDPMGHGTHVAGSILGRGVTSGGKIRGGAYFAGFVIEGLWSPIVSGLTVPPQLNTLFDQAYTSGARVHSNSWGSAADFGAYDSMANQVDDYIWNHPDFLVLFAAGNSGVDHDKDGRIDPNSIGSPGTAKNCITVGASKNYVLHGGIQKKISELKAAPNDWPAEPIWSSQLSETPNGMAMFSSRGPTQDNRIKPDVVAPGTNVLSDRSHVASAEVLWGAYNADYAWSGGTSMATPVSAGFAVLTREILQKRWNQANPSAALIKAVMMHTAFDMYPGQFGFRQQGQELLTVRPNNDEGYGRLDMDKILSLGSNTVLVDSKAGVAQGENFETQVTVKAGEKLVVNLVYSDAPGTPAAAQALVNDLDLVVIDPSGSQHGSHDHINNAEVVELKAGASGIYKIQVQGVNVPMGMNGKQAFALVYTHN